MSKLADLAMYGGGAAVVAGCFGYDWRLAAIVCGILLIVGGAILATR